MHVLYKYKNLTPALHFVQLGDFWCAVFNCVTSYACRRHCL